MRLLFFIEPVVFWSDPSRLAAHLVWVRYIEQAIEADGTLGLASNTEVCRAWENSHERKTSSYAFPIDPYAPLANFSWRRDKYSAALYGSGRERNSIVRELEAIKRQFQPDLAVSTCQSAFFDRVFADVPRLYLEQAPLPRYGQPFRTVFDPSGHQVGSLLETRARNIRNLRLSDAEMLEAFRLLDELPELLRNSDDRSKQGCEILEGLRSEGSIALLATQPPDWTTYEGAYRVIDLEGLLCDWDARLPEGWVGVPTFHPHGLLPSSVQETLARSRKKLRFLPPEFSQGMTEPLLTVADALVTISSSCAATALLLEKPIVVEGRSPFSVWGAQDIAKLNRPIRWERSIAGKLLAFLTHRYSRSAEQLHADPAWTRQLLEKRLHDDGRGDWQLDLSEWTAADARAHFRFCPF
jgi:hypothetical protein